MIDLLLMGGSVVTVDADAAYFRLEFDHPVELPG